jgi:NAD(P)-dependent dehydrogenase (short-subunit alcohol dehydrogenase family)
MATGSGVLAGEVVLVTGAGRGIGLGIASAMAAAGAQVAMVSRSSTQLKEASRGVPGSLALPFDVANFPGIPGLVDRVESHFGAPITTVVHGAGTHARHKAEDFDLDEWKRVIEVNLIAPFALSQEIGRRQLGAGQPGQHIFIGSLTSFISIPETSAYTASKSGVFGVVRSLSQEWSGRGIRVNGIAPGYVRTELTEVVFSDPERSARNLSRIPMGRFGVPDDIAQVAVFLASKQSAYVTGQMLPVDGGWLSA